MCSKFGKSTSWQLLDSWCSCPSCLQWLEFGVAGGATTTWMAKYREAVCGSHPDTSGATHTGVVGFDTFTGLPEVCSFTLSLLVFRLIRDECELLIDEGCTQCAIQSEF